MCIFSVFFPCVTYSYIRIFSFSPQMPATPVFAMVISGETTLRKVSQ